MNDVTNSPRLIDSPVTNPFRSTSIATRRLTADGVMTSTSLVLMNLVVRNVFGWGSPAVLTVRAVSAMET